MSTNPNDPAFSDEVIPVPLPGSTPHAVIYKEKRAVGLTKREYFSVEALKSLLSHCNKCDHDKPINFGISAMAACIAADYLIVELSKEAK